MELKMATERIYVIGAGFIAGTHVGAVGKLPGGNGMEVHVSDSNPETLKKFKEKFPRVVTHTDTREMLADPARPDDIVIVSTPPSSHCVLTLQGLQSGRHVLCEKPLAMNQDEARRMLEMARKTGLRLGCCSTRFIGHFSTEMMKRWLEEGKLGELYQVTWRHRTQSSREDGVFGKNGDAFCLDRAKNGGGTLMDWSPYDFTTLNNILQPVKVDVLDAWMAPPPSMKYASVPAEVVVDAECHAGAVMTYHCKNGTCVRVNFERAKCTYGEPATYFEFEGTLGAVKLDWLGEEGLKIYFDDAGKVKTQIIPYEKKGTDPFMLERPLCYFHEVVNGRNSPAVLNEQAVFNFNCIRAIYDCVEKGRSQTVIMEQV